MMRQPIVMLSFVKMYKQYMPYAHHFIELLRFNTGGTVGDGRSTGGDLFCAER